MVNLVRRRECFAGLSILVVSVPPGDDPVHVPSMELGDDHDGPEALLLGNVHPVLSRPGLQRTITLLFQLFFIEKIYSVFSLFFKEMKSRFILFSYRIIVALLAAYSLMFWGDDESSKQYCCGFGSKLDPYYVTLYTFLKIQKTEL